MTMGLLNCFAAADAGAGRYTGAGALQPNDEYLMNDREIGLGGGVPATCDMRPAACALRTQNTALVVLRPRGSTGRLKLVVFVLWLAGRTSLLSLTSRSTFISAQIRLISSGQSNNPN